MSEKVIRCGGCGLPLAKCSALVAGRIEAENWLKMEGYKSGEARRVAYELIPSRTKAQSIADEGEGK